MTQWNSLFCLLNDNPVAPLEDSLQQLEYQLYNAFDLLPGKSYPYTLKTFIVPSDSQWTQILLDDETDFDDLEALAETLSKHGLVLLTHLDLDEATIDVYNNGAAVDIVDSLSGHLLAGKSTDDLTRAFDGQVALPLIDATPDEQSQILAIDDLPDDIRMMTQGLNMGKAQNMFQRMTSNFMGRGQAQDAQAMINPDTLDWNGEGGMWIRGILACLIQGDAWLSPDFPTVRDAYQRHVRKQRRPNAKLYPGDQQMMDAVPNALDYIPVYGGQNE